MSLATLDKQAVERFTREFESLFDAGDAAGMAACYAPGARLLAENAPLVTGRAAVERFWAQAIARARAGAAGAVRTITLDEVTSSGGLGYALGTVTVTLPDGPALTAKYATIWQRDPGGRWRLAVDSSSPNPRPQAAAPAPATASVRQVGGVHPRLAGRRRC